MSNLREQILALTIFCVFFRAIIGLELMARPEFMPPRITDRSYGIKLLLQEVRDLDLNPNTGAKQASGTPLKNEAAILSLKSDNKPVFDHHFRCTNTANDINLPCCSSSVGLTECESAKMRQIRSFSAKKPVRKTDKLQSEIQLLVADFERNLIDRFHAKIRREAATQQG